MWKILVSICKSPNQREIYIWNILGSFTNAMLSMVTLMIVTRTVSGKEADIFSIAWSISQLMATIGTFQIRNYQATDVKEVFKFKQYLLFRIFTIAIMLISSVGYIIVKHYDFYKSIIIFVVCMYRAIDALAEIYEGLFQQKERLDLAGKAITFRVIMGTIIFGIALSATRSVLIAVSALLFTYVGCFFITNYRYYIVIEKLNKKYNKDNKDKLGFGWVFHLFKEGLPLFINAFLMTAITNEPKMVVDQAIEQGMMSDGMQTIFSVLFMPASVLTLVYIVFRPMLTRMAIMWNEKNIRSFLRVIWIILICLVGIAVVLLIGSAVLGIPILSWIYALNLEGERSSLLLFVFGGCFCTFSYVLDNALVVIRYQYVLILSYIVTWGYVKIVTGWLVEKYALMGAAIAYATSMIVFFCFTAVLFVVCLNRSKKRWESRNAKI